MLVEERAAVRLVDLREQLRSRPQPGGELARAVVGEIRRHRVQHHDDGIPQLREVLEVSRPQLHDPQVLGEYVALAGVDAQGRRRVGAEPRRGDEEHDDDRDGVTLGAADPGRGEATEQRVDGAGGRPASGLGRPGGCLAQGSGDPHGAW